MARKKPISPKNRAAYERLVNHFGGPEKTREKLGLASRQVVHSWGQWGIPKKHWDAISKVTKWPLEKIVPDPYN